jgi:hypothetical protein
MYPLLDWDTIVVSVPVDYSSIKVGDIICYRANNEKVLHRVIRKTSSYLVLQGDNLIRPDSVTPGPGQTYQKAIAAFYFDRMSDTKPKITGTFKQEPLPLKRDILSVLF